MCPMKNKSYTKAAAATGVFFMAVIVALAGCGGGGDADTWSEITRSGVWRIGTDATYPPFETVDTDLGEVVGFDIDLISAVCAKYELKPEFIITPFDGIVPGLTTAKYDAIIPRHLRSPRSERAAFYFPIPITTPAR